MGLVPCDVHGQCPIDLVSPKLRAMCLRRRRIGAEELHLVRYHWVPDLPNDMALQICFCDREFAERFGYPLGRTLTEEEVERHEPVLGLLEPVCAKCFQEWLKENDIDLRTAVAG